MLLRCGMRGELADHWYAAHEARNKVQRKERWQEINKDNTHLKGLVELAHFLQERVLVSR